LEPDTVNEALKAFNYVCEFLNEIRKILPKKGEWEMFGSKKKEIIERKFREALEGTKNAIEYYIWFGKGFAIGAECGLNVDKEFHFLIAVLTKIFKDISMRLVPEKLNDELVTHLQGQLKILEDYAQRFWQIQGINAYPDKENKAIAIIENFRQRLSDFERSMEPYLKSEEIKKD
jgi:hypothetical protein